MIFTEEQKKNISQLLRVCSVHNETMFFKCAFLAIIGGESGFVPQVESCFYSSKERLKGVFSFLSDKDCENLLRCKNPMQFFSVVYGPTRRGNGFLGNESDADGGKYFGRGYVQITGRINYRKVGNLCSLDFEDNPSLVCNKEFAASAAFAYITLYFKPKRNYKTYEEYFRHMQSCVGKDISKGKKLEYFNFFMSDEGQKLIEDLERKSNPDLSFSKSCTNT